MFPCSPVVTLRSTRELGPYPFKGNQWCKQTVLCAVLRLPSRAKDKTLCNFADQHQVCVPSSQDATRLLRGWRSRSTYGAELRVKHGGHRGGPETHQDRAWVRSLLNNSLPKSVSCLFFVFLFLLSCNKHALSVVPVCYFFYVVKWLGLYPDIWNDPMTHNMTTLLWLFMQCWPVSSSDMKKSLFIYFFKNLWKINHKKCDVWCFNGPFPKRQFLF